MFVQEVTLFVGCTILNNAFQLLNILNIVLENLCDFIKNFIILSDNITLN